MNAVHGIKQHHRVIVEEERYERGTILIDKIEVRTCTAEDAPALALIGAATFLETFAGLVPGAAMVAHCEKNHVPGAYIAHLAKQETRAWLAEAFPGAAPVGYALLTSPDFRADLTFAGDLELRRIYLFSRFHASGIGRRMMDLAIESAREQAAGRLLLGVHPENRRAIAFYRKNGFVQIGVRKFQVGDAFFEDPVFALGLS